MIEDVASAIFSEQQKPTLPQTTTTIYGTAVTDSSSGVVSIVMDGESVTQPSSEDTTVTLMADEFTNGQADLPSVAYPGTVVVTDSNGRQLDEDEFQVDDDILTIEALQGGSQVVVEYLASMTIHVNSEQFSDGVIELPYTPVGDISVTVDGEAVEYTIDGANVTIPEAVAETDAVFEVTYSRDVSLSPEFDDRQYVLPDEPEEITLVGVTLSETEEAVETPIADYTLDGALLVIGESVSYEAYRLTYTLTDSVSFNWSDTLPEEDDEAEGVIVDGEEESSEEDEETSVEGGVIELPYHPTSVSVTKNGEAYSDYTLDDLVITLAWKPDEPATYTFDFQAIYSIEHVSSEFAIGGVTLAYMPVGEESGETIIPTQMSVTVDGEPVAYSLNELELSVPSLMTNITSYEVSYKTEVASGEIEVPTAPGVRAGESVQISVINGTPTVTSVIGEGDRQDTNINIAYETAADAKELADEANTVATATNQHFWHRSTDPNSDGAGTGAFVTDEEQATFLQAIASGTEPTDSRPLHNLLMNAEGILLRAAKHIRAAFTQSGIAFYDGVANLAKNIVARFGKDGAQIGVSDNSHIEMDYHSLKLIDKEQNVYFHVSDLRDKSGLATIEDVFTGDGTTKRFSLSLLPSSLTSVTVSDGSGGSYTQSGTVFDFSTAPSAGATITIEYTTTDDAAKAYTLGTRDDGIVGAMSVVAGESCVASGTRSYAEGYSTTASGAQAHAEGGSTTASGGRSHAEGYSTTASGSRAHAEGQLTTASGINSHAEGERTTASGNHSHAEGSSTTASGSHSHAEGLSTTASGNYSHAEGRLGTASGMYAHSEGMQTTASGLGSHAQNVGTIAASLHQTAIGRYNVEDSNDTYALIIGNGASNKRSNMMTVDWNGSTQVYLKDIDSTAAKPGSDQTANVLEVMDASGVRIAQIRVGRDTDGNTGIAIVGRQGTSTTGGVKQNNLWVWVSPTGECTYYIPNPPNFREAINAVGTSNQALQNATLSTLNAASQHWVLRSNVVNSNNTTYRNHNTGLGITNSNAFLYDFSGDPETGTGKGTIWSAYTTKSPQPADAWSTTKTTTISSVISAASGITINSLTYTSWGNMAMLSINMKGFAASTGTQTVGTIVSGKRPADAAYATDIGSVNATYALIGTDGKLTVAWSVAPSTTGSYTARFIYILA